MINDIKHCTACQFHQPFGEHSHLCTLPPECAPPQTDDDDTDHWRDREERKSTYVGTSCDVMRRMGAMCGPRGHLWSAADGR